MSDYEAFVDEAVRLGLRPRGNEACTHPGCGGECCLDYPTRGEILLSLVEAGVGMWSVWTSKPMFNARYVNYEDVSNEIDPDPVTAALRAYIAAKEGEGE